MAIEKKIVIDVDAVKAAGGIDKLTESLKETNKEVKGIAFAIGNQRGAALTLHLKLELRFQSNKI